MQRVIRSISVLFSLGFFTVASAQLPPEIMVDKHLVRSEQLHAAGNYAEAFKVMEKIIALQKEHSLTLPDEFHFKYARVALAADSIRIALESVTRYLSATEKEGEFYKEALALLLEAEGTQISAGEACTGKPEGSSCWKELISHPQCYVWDDYYYENQTVIWSGKCSGSVADGEGTLIWERANEKVHYTGHLQKGKQHGKWIIRDSDRAVEGEGPYVDGKKHGHWIERYYQYIDEGSYKDGKRHGKWVERVPDDGTVSEGSYVDGKKDGKWVTRVTRESSEAVMQGFYMEGKRHGGFSGDWELCSSSESSLKVSFSGKYVEGKPQGYWRNDPFGPFEWFGRVVGSGSYEDGLRQGTWIFQTYICRYPSNESVWNGRIKGDYIDGKQDGTWLYYSQSDVLDWECRTYTYRQGKRVEAKKVNMKICRQAEW